MICRPAAIVFRSSKAKHPFDSDRLEASRRPRDLTRSDKGPEAPSAYYIWFRAKPFPDINVRDLAHFSPIHPAIAKEFEIPNALQMKGLGSLPEKVIQASLEGKHKPVNPHRQRLLVAANKAVEVEKIPPAAAPKSKQKGKATANKEEPKATCNDDHSESPKPTTSSQPPKKRAPYADTPYNVARKKFFATSLD